MLLLVSWCWFMWLFFFACVFSAWLFVMGVWLVWVWVLVGVFVVSMEWDLVVVFGCGWFTEVDGFGGL